MSFETFLTQYQRTFNIFDKEGEGTAEEAKICFLFRKIKHPGLQTSIEALKALETTWSAITYTTAANHIATAVSELPEIISKNTRNIPNVLLYNSGDTQGGTGIYNNDGS